MGSLPRLVVKTIFKYKYDPIRSMAYRPNQINVMPTRIRPQENVRTKWCGRMVCNRSTDECCLYVRLTDPKMDMYNYVVYPEGTTVSLLLFHYGIRIDQSSQGTSSCVLLSSYIHSSLLASYRVGKILKNLSSLWINDTIQFFHENDIHYKRIYYRFRMGRLSVWGPTELASWLRYYNAWNENSLFKTHKEGESLYVHSHPDY